jgi:hypothetical protein
VDLDPALSLISDPDLDLALALISDLRFGFGLFMKNTLGFILFLRKAQRIPHPCLYCRSFKLRKKAYFLKFVHFYYRFR